MQIIVLPGLDGDGNLAQPFCDALRGHSVTALNYPDHLTSYADLVPWVLAQLPKGPVTLIAQSFSGPVAAQLVQQQSAKIDAVVYVATFAMRPRRIPKGAVRAARYLPITSGFMIKLMQPWITGQWSDAAFLAQFSQSLSRVKSETLIARLRAVLSVDVRSHITHATVPSIYLRASCDRLVPRRASTAFSNVVTVEGPHFLLQTVPTEAAAVVADFLNTLSVDRAP
ncbi:pimeloyl-ACP methyl ester carboxylesterase [Yoonia maricola]|uniref:Pimeloyl-ACP methyl ester carboxylesterase n=1 Tax=Yoonia maricola TaxID=420999 RepID=A0A2M8WMG8_9RHOB|nr:alpha/beta hydrolase [Yoonia maricola]PJI92093.1 pimeloyl-ACP methyl ester carboxylesterase [Yoonia maricola]